MAKARFTIFLLDGVSAPEDALSPDAAKSPTAIELSPASGLSGRFFLVTRAPRKPPWATYVEPLLAAPIDTAKIASASGLLVVAHGSRHFAVTFGHGRSLLDLSKVVSRFGLRVVLNRVAPDKLRSIDTKTLEDQVISSASQASRSVDAAAFGIDSARDILRAVAGDAVDERLGSRISGSDALVVAVDLEATGLATVLTEAAEAFGEAAYEERFGWVDDLRAVRTGAESDGLNETLIRQLRSGDTSGMHLAMPEVKSWDEIDTFLITGAKGREFFDLDLDEYAEALPDGFRNVTVSQLKSRRVSIRWARSGEIDAQWPLFKCLVGEVRGADGQLYVLSDGQWYEVSESLTEEIDRQVATIAIDVVSAPDALDNEKEGAFNTRLAEFAVDRLRLDGVLARPPGASSDIELCDVLTKDGTFVHVKRKSRSSSLSHLFAQGSVSFETFIESAEFRARAREKMKQLNPPDLAEWLELLPSGDEPVDRGRYRVAYCVVASSARSGNDWLPFFSKLNLVNHARQVRRLGAAATVQRIPVVPA
ncbi:DUF6119 family protein [Agrococcus sp. 1P02AA]|uniref:DUF6119 family protein n=1 Tax=Agrococcus sp. 1P02AA TaxID=3132259 RepID=UPI0039A6C131